MSDLHRQALKSGKAKPPRSPSDSDGEGEEGDVVGELNTEPKPQSNLKIQEPTVLFPIIDHVDGAPLYFHQGKNELIFLCIHGAGLSGVSFTPLAVRVAPFASCASFDFPGHGNHLAEAVDPQLSMPSLLAQSLRVLTALAQRFEKSTFVIVGHSLGGSVATRLARLCEASSDQSIHSKVVGLIVIDVVEGSALDALPFMKNLLIGRPKHFPSRADGIKYLLKSRTINNPESAELTGGSQLVQREGKWVWRANLLATEGYWQEWFQGLNENFLNCQLPKILILANAERMDKELTIAQMQGRFKLVVLGTPVGHLVHEDDPDETARQFLLFLKQFRIPLSTDQLAQLKSLGIGKFNNGL